MRADPQHWRDSPLLADQAGLPPTLVVTAGLDPLRDKGRAYAGEMIEAGVDVTYREVPGTIHGFLQLSQGDPLGAGRSGRLLAIAKAMIAEAQAARLSIARKSGHRVLPQNSDAKRKSRAAAGKIVARLSKSNAAPGLTNRMRDLAPWRRNRHRAMAAGALERRWQG